VDYLAVAFDDVDFIGLNVVQAGQVVLVDLLAQVVNPPVITVDVTGDLAVCLYIDVRIIH